MDSFLFQTNDNITFEKKKFQVVSKIKPTNKIMDELIFSFNVCRSVKSNANRTRKCTTSGTRSELGWTRRRHLEDHG